MFISGAICCSVLVVFLLPIISGLSFDYQNRPQVQEAVHEQCDLPDYIAKGDFSDDDGRYYDSLVQNGHELLVSCDQNLSGDWQCTCTERK